MIKYTCDSKSQHHGCAIRSSLPGDRLWWYHVNKYRAMRGKQSELAPRQKSPRCHVNTPLGKSWLYPNYDRLALFLLFRCFFLYVPLTT